MMRAFSRISAMALPSSSEWVKNPASTKATANTRVRTRLNLTINFIGVFSPGRGIGFVGRGGTGFVTLGMNDRLPFGKSREVVLNCLAKCAVLKPRLESLHASSAPGRGDHQPALDFSVGNIMVGLRDRWLGARKARPAGRQDIAKRHWHGADE